MWMQDVAQFLRVELMSFIVIFLRRDSQKKGPDRLCLHDVEKKMPSDYASFLSFIAGLL
jgi:hypothetical protein